MKIIRGMEVAGVVIPTAHIRARSGQARTLSKWFQQRVLIQAEKQFVVVFKLCPEESLEQLDRKSTRLNSSHGYISYAVFCLKKKKTTKRDAVRLASAPCTHRRPALSLALSIL